MNTENVKCADCDESCEENEYTDNLGNSVCADCAEDYCYDEITDETIRADDSVQAIHYTWRNRSGQHRVTTHSDNTTYIHGEYYTEDAVDEYFIMCEVCSEYVDRDYCVCDDYSCYCEGCAPSPNCEEYDGGRDVDSDDTEYIEMTSRRSFGLELEYADASDCAEDNKNSGYHWFECKEDGSLRGDSCAEFASPVLRGDTGLEAIRDFADCAKHTDPNETCGFHLHVGMDDFSDKQKALLVRFCAKIEKVARMFVPRNRSNNTYCQHWLNCADADDSAEFHRIRNSARYSAFNFCTGYDTLEIRLHHSTNCADEMVNWVKLWCAVLDYVAGCNNLKAWDGLSDQAIFNKLTGLAGREIAEFYADRAERYGYSDSIKKEDISFNLDCPGQMFLF